MKKVLLLSLLMLFVSICCSCKFNYINIEKLINKNYTGKILNEYRRIYNLEDGNVKITVLGVNLIKSSQLTEEEKALFEEKHGYNFVNVWVMNAVVDYGDHKESTSNMEIIEFANEKEAEYALENCYTLSKQKSRCLKNNIMYVRNSANYLLLGEDCQRKDDMLISNDVLLRTYLGNSKLVIPDDITKTAMYACISSKINSVVCGESLEIIDSFSFGNCKNLTSVTLNNKLREIGSYAFADSSKLEFVIIPSSVEYIGEYAFNSGILYCEAEKKPAGWDDMFATSDVYVYWKNEWTYDENKNPVLIL